LLVVVILLANAKMENFSPNAFFDGIYTLCINIRTFHVLSVTKISYL